MNNRWLAMRERGSLWSMRLALWLYRRGGHLLLYPAAWLAVLYFFFSRPATRRYSRRYLHRVLGRPVGWRTLWRHQWAFARSLIMRLAAWMDRIKLSEVDFPGHQTLLELQQQRRGPVLLGAHFGNLEMCRALVENDQSLTLNVILHTAPDEKFSRVLHSISDRSRVRLIPVGEVTPLTAMQLQEKLARGEILIMMADRLPPGNEERHFTQAFLGREARFPAGPFLLSLLLEAPVYFFVGYETPRGYTTRFELLKEAGRVPRSRREQICKDMLSDYVTQLEAVCREQPLQWFNFYDFWNEDED